MPKIIGIDPGLVNTGWAIVDTNNTKIIYIASGTINTQAAHALPIRLLKINVELVEVANIYLPSNAAIEETYVNNNYSSSLKLAHARGAAIVTLANFGLPVTEYPAKTVKKTICGSGKAEKVQIERMLSLIFPNITFKSSDESDALAIAVCHAMHFKG